MRRCACQHIALISRHSRVDGKADRVIGIWLDAQPAVGVLHHRITQDLAVKGESQPQGAINTNYVRLDGGQDLSVVDVRQQYIDELVHIRWQSAQAEGPGVKGELAASCMPPLVAKNRCYLEGGLLLIVLVLVWRGRIEHLADNGIREAEKRGANFLVIALAEGESWRISGREGHGKREVVMRAATPTLLLQPNRHVRPQAQAAQD